ncbi:prophage DNA circulation protein [Arthrobacter ginsengisoli]|uniref:Prophage DNA circulation protein n=1 Tax=Arthrobacter ginsengisoli TaxID=1356565 RepID=A0ABU1UI43_9MICC|nr:ANTAR domain-containing protein [Arthrobacter ginsengisoli]MDR7084872.1 prophage DNA circulation protein [Arthrobacter ginsengisoli]
MRDSSTVASAHSTSTSTSTRTMLDLVLDSTEPGSGVDGFLTQLSRLAASELSRPDHEVSCGITVNRRKQPTSEAGSTGAAAASVLQIPVALDDATSAVVHLYSPRADAFSAEDLADAQQFVSDAAQALLLALRISQLTESRDNLAAAMQSRTTIDTAIGAVMAQNRCGRDDAFKILRNTSNNRNLKIRDVAAAVVASIAGDTDVTARFQE